MKRRTLHDAVDELLPTSACVIWPGNLDSDGYGPYRVTYVRHFGLVPDGLVLDHTCHKLGTGCAGGKTCVHRGCVNPAHLEAVTQRENMRRSIITRFGRLADKCGWPLADGRCA